MFTSFEISMATGNSVELKTFKSYGVDKILEFKTEEKDGRTFNIHELYLV